MPAEAGHRARRLRRICGGRAGRCLYAPGMIRHRYDQCQPHWRHQTDRSGPVPDHPVARGRARLRPRCSRVVPGSACLSVGCALAEDATALIDAPPSTAGRRRLAGVPPILPPPAGTPVRLMLNDEVIARGTAPMRPVLSGTATQIATGGPAGGADAVAMVEHTQPPAIAPSRCAARSRPAACFLCRLDIARGEAPLRAGTAIGSREIGMLAACGIAEATVARRRVAVLRPATSWCLGCYYVLPRSTTPTAPSSPRRLSRTAVMRISWARSPTTSRRPRCAARLMQATCWCSQAARRRRWRRLPPHHRKAFSGIIARRGAETGKPLCLAVCDGKPVVILPGFPTSAMPLSTTAIVPVLRNGRPAAAQRRQGFRTRAGAHRLNSAAPNSSWCRWSRAPMACSPIQARARRDHVVCAGRRFLRIDALADQMLANSKPRRPVHAACTRARPRHHRQPHRARSRHRADGACRPCRALNRGRQPRRACGRQGGECDLALIHLFDEKSETYNTPYLSERLSWCRRRRMQGIVFRRAMRASRD